MILYAATAFASAFLLFLVQPLLAKYILPWFGGSPGVWTTCLLFFQVLLTAGYSYAHLLASRFTRRSQATITIGFLLLTLASLPITPARASGDISAPTWQILKLLFVSIGLCYFLLSSTAPLLQSWFSHRFRGASPYRLYTLSNLGSLLAIVSYPLVIEPRLGLGIQTKFWSWLYIVFAILSGACAMMLWRAGSRLKVNGTTLPTDSALEAATSPQWPDRIMWLALTALSCTLLMATTNQLCLDVAVIPLLWLLPMGLYLISFILCFHSERWYSRRGFGIALAVALAQTCFVLYRGIFISVPMQIASYCFTLFICCMICHGELVRLKPGNRHLTSFYLMISAGGAIGGTFAALVAPHVFLGYWEFHLGLAVTALIFLIVLFRNRHGYLYAGRPVWAWTMLGISFLALIIALVAQILGSLTNTVTVKRNFFGVLRVMDDNPSELKHRTVLMHGRIEHGYQFYAEEKRYWPTSYFGPSSGVGIAIRYHPRRIDPAQRHLRVGIVGLGTGTIASYGEQDDYFRFYEINPAVLDISNLYFTYRKDSAAQVDVVLGDARISMERAQRGNQPGAFDVLAIDAFSSDAIPVHLLTRECYQHYWYHLKKDGILALHISSRYFNLSPVIRGLAENDRERKPQAVLVEDPGSSMQETDATRWILVTSNQEFLANPDVKAAISPWSTEDSKPFLFTDDYSNLLTLLKRQ
jgi:SAM-dependent methyltransferase